MDGPETGWDVRIRALRSARGWTQAGLAARLGTTPRVVQDYEQGRRSPGPSAQIILRDLARWPAYDPASPDAYTVSPVA